MTRDVVANHGTDYCTDRRVAGVTMANMVSHYPADYAPKNDRRG